MKDFSGGDGTGPTGNLIAATNGKLYGTTSGGGNNNAGVIFSFDVSSSTFTKLWDFNLSSGSDPNGLMQASDEKLYGTTRFGGNTSYGEYDGVLFSFDIASSVYTKLYDFDYSKDARAPTGTLKQAIDGKLYGTTTEGGPGDGVLFSFDISSSAYTDLHDFSTRFGGIPHGLMQASDGKFYGITAQGGSDYVYHEYDGSGIIFSFDPISSTFMTVKDFAGSGTSGGELAHLLK